MIKFNSPIIIENVWKLCLVTKKELLDIYYEDKNTEKKEEIKAVIEFTTSTIYIDKELDDETLLKQLRNKLVHLYLWETGQQNRLFNEEELCDLASVTIPTIYKMAENLLQRVKNEDKEE